MAKGHKRATLDARLNDPEYREKENAKQRERNRAARDRMTAHNSVGAISRAVDIRPNTCSQCGLETPNIQAHHHNGYDEAHKRDVVWICVDCHGKAHRKHD